MHTKIDNDDWGHSKYEAFLDLNGDYTQLKGNITGAAAVCFNDKGEVVLVGKEPTGGHIEIGETPIDAIKREALEEAGFRIDKYKYYGYYLINQSESASNKFQSKYPKQAYILFFIAKGSVVSKPTDANAGELEMVNYKEALKSNKITHKMLREALKLYPNYTNE